MKILFQNSLGRTIEAINDALFYRRKIAPTDAKKAAAWLARRRGKPMSYAGMFAPTPFDFRHGLRLFTGEIIRSRAAIAHILGEESCRALLVLQDRDLIIKKALQRASKGILSRLKESNPFMQHGFYCCGICSVSLWRHLNAGGLHVMKNKLTIGLKTLRRMRDGKGQWRRFPYFYTLHALHEINTPASRAEIRYALPVLKKYMKQPPRASKYSRLRHDLARRILKNI